MLMATIFLSLYRIRCRMSSPAILRKIAPNGHAFAIFRNRYIVFIYMLNTVLVFDGFRSWASSRGRGCKRWRDMGNFCGKYHLDTQVSWSIIACPFFLKRIASGRTFILTTACHASTAELIYLIVDAVRKTNELRLSRRRCFLWYILLFPVLVGHIPKVSQFVMLICHIESHQEICISIQRVPYGRSSNQRFRFLGLSSIGTSPICQLIHLSSRVLRGSASPVCGERS